MSYKTDIEILRSYAKEIINNTSRDDKCKIEFEFSCIKDSLCKDGEISEKTYNNCYLSLDSYYPCICCGSYRVRV